MTRLDASSLRRSWRAWLGSEPDPVGPAWLSLVWTFLFCCICAVFFTALTFATQADGDRTWHSWTGWARWYGVNLVVALCIGFTIRGLFQLGHYWLGSAKIRRLGRWGRLAYFIGLPNLGVAIGWPLGAAIMGYEAIPASRLENPSALAGSILFVVIVSVIFYLLFSAAARRLQAEKRAAEAQLRLLQGQIEPHFLFNTLANVSSLMDDDMPRAKQMLETFTDYLRASLGSLRRQDATLGGELDLVGHYLDLMKTRMEGRLQYEVQCDADLRNAHLPPFLLQPLVENALHHGLEPKVEGGTVRVKAWRESDALVLEVRDDGVGLQAPRRRPGAGLALANLRERLEVQFGGAASLTLVPTNPGMCATVRMPHVPGATP